LADRVKALAKDNTPGVGRRASPGQEPGHRAKDLNGMDRHEAVARRRSRRLFGEVFVGQLNGDGAFADGGGDALDGPVAYVPGGEDAGEAGLQE